MLRGLPRRGACTYPLRGWERDPGETFFPVIISHIRISNSKIPNTISV